MVLLPHVGEGKGAGGNRLITPRAVSQTHQQGGQSFQLIN